MLVLYNDTYFEALKTLVGDVERAEVLLSLPRASALEAIVPRPQIRTIQAVLDPPGPTHE